MAYNKPQQITDPMPRRHHQDDAQWINTKLASCADMKERFLVCEAYTKVYSEAFDAEKSEHKSSNAARKCANERLRIFIAKKSRVFNR